MEDEIDIIKALQTGVIDAVAQSDKPDLPVKYLSVGNEADGSWSIPQDQTWLEVVWLPNNPIENIDNSRHHRGILRLVLHYPNEGGGVYAPMRLLASVTRYFTKGLILSGVQIYATPATTGKIEDGDDALFPASILYQSYRKGN